MSRTPKVVRDGSSNTISIIPPSGTHSSTIVWMHGLGDSADGFFDVAQMLSTQMPYTKFILPTAPSQPVTLNGGMVMNSWYDIKGLGDRAAEECEGIEESVSIVRKILEKENSIGIPYNRMVLAGFSQVCFLIDVSS
jgi:lysophospholipase-2